MVGMLAFVGLFTSGCKPQTEAQIKAIAQQAGMFSAVGWIAIDNPTPEIKSAVKGALVVISENVTSIEAGKTYTEVLYPIVIQYVVENVDSQYGPLTKAGAISLLGGIDMLFAANPEIRNQEGLAIDVIQAFSLGAEAGLSMSNDDAIMKAALQSAALRTSLRLNPALNPKK
jgi:hypothetical protein